jgi:hypothetical protein
MVTTANPVLRVEELRRRPLRARPAPAAGAARVYLGRSGRFYAPTGGLSASELWRRAPRRSYDVDLTPHALTTSFELAGVTVELTGLWRTTSPVAVVTHHVENVLAVARPRLVALVEAVAAEAGPTELAGLLDGAVFPPVNLPEGICVYQLRAAVRPAAVEPAPA